MTATAMVMLMATTKLQTKVEAHRRTMHKTKVAEKTFHYPIMKYTFQRCTLTLLFVFIECFGLGHYFATSFYFFVPPSLVVPHRIPFHPLDCYFFYSLSLPFSFLCVISFNCSKNVNKLYHGQYDFNTIVSVISTVGALNS